MCVSICFCAPPAMSSPWNYRHIRLFSSSKIALMQIGKVVLGDTILSQPLSHLFCCLVEVEVMAESRLSTHC